MRNSRKFRRVGQKVSVVVTPRSDKGAPAGKAIFCHTINISARGVGITAGSPLPQGVPVELRMASTEPPVTFTFAGTVCWVSETGNPPTYFMGLDLGKSPEKIIKAWEAFVNEKIPRWAKGDEDRLYAKD